MSTDEAIAEARELIAKNFICEPCVVVRLIAAIDSLRAEVERADVMYQRACEVEHDLRAEVEKWQSVAVTMSAERERVRVLRSHGVEALMVARSWQMVWGDKLSPESVAIFTKHEQAFLAALAATKEGA